MTCLLRMVSQSSIFRDGPSTVHLYSSFSAGSHGLVLDSTGLTGAGPFLCSLPTHCPAHAELRVASHFHEELGAPKRLCSMLGLCAWNVNLSSADSLQHHLKS